MAVSGLREPPRDGLLSGTLLTLITPDSMETVPAKAGKNILCVEHELLGCPKTDTPTRLRIRFGKGWRF
jgi:hypothetical protein